MHLATPYLIGTKDTVLPPRKTVLPPTEATLYHFGTWQGAGHFVWEPDQDGGCKPSPKYSESSASELFGRGVFFHHLAPSESEGETALHYLRDQRGNTWTIAMGASSLYDSRPGGVRGFFIQGVFSFEEMLLLIEDRYPTLWRDMHRDGRALTLVQT